MKTSLSTGVRLSLILMLTMAFVQPALAQSLANVRDSALSSPNMSGIWVGTTQWLTLTYSFTLNIIQTDNQLSGTCVWSDGPTCTITGTVNSLSVSWTRADVGSSYKAYFSGTLSSDYQSMSGTWSDSVGHAGSWQAVKQESFPKINISVNTSGHFIYSDPTYHASLPLQFHVTDSNGLPIMDAAISISDVFLGNTDGNGDLDISLPISSLPINGDYIAPVIALINGLEYSSDPMILYSSVLKNQKEFTVTQAEAESHTTTLLDHALLRPGIGDLCPDTPANLYLSAGCEIVSAVVMFLKIHQMNSMYSPMAGDFNKIELYEYSAPNVTPVYLYSESASRGGSSIYRRSTWTEDYSAAKKYFTPQDIDRTSLNVQLNSPATLMIINSLGKRSGFDPNTGLFVFDIPITISDKGEEPYLLVLPSPSSGQYKLLVSGTGNGTYNLSIQTLAVCRRESSIAPRISIPSKKAKDSCID